MQLLERMAISIFVFLLLAGSAHAYDRRTPVVEAVQKAGPAVVNIRTEKIVQRSSSAFGFGDPFFEEFFRGLAPPRVYRTESLGSGVIVDPRGYILTNAHVIEKASEIFVALPSGKKEKKATLVGADESLDLAVLKMEGEKSYSYLPLATSGDLMLGETVIAIGNPLGLGHSITTGIVSAPLRRLALNEGNVSGFIQTDALINPGNSGGPLININGELIGINTAIARQAQGIGFSIPADTARRVLGELIEYGEIRPSWVGITPGEVGKALVKSRGEGGVLVLDVEEGSPADEAGMRMADVILSVDGLAVESVEEYLNLLSSWPPGSVVSFDILRGTETLAAKIHLRPLPPDYAVNFARRIFGFTIRDSRQGVEVKDVVQGSPAERVGLRPGDIVAEANGKRVKDAEDYRRILERLKGKVPVTFLVLRGNRGYYVELP